MFLVMSMMNLWSHDFFYLFVKTINQNCYKARNLAETLIPELRILEKLEYVHIFKNVSTCNFMSFVYTTHRGT